jgi:hypothetical protein
MPTARRDAAILFNGSVEEVKSGLKLMQVES